MKRIVTHSKPDADAIAAAWLAETFMFPGEEIEVAFAPRPRPGQPAPDADCVVDIACVHDPKRLVFDHKGPAFADRNATCATQLVWEHLLSLGRPVGHLEALVRVVHEGDRSPPGRPSPELARSRSEGFHSRLKQARARGGGDHQVYRVMRGWLDLHDREERAQGRPARSPGQDVHGATPAAPEALDENAEVGGPQATTASPGDVHPERTAWDRPSIAVVPPSRPSPTTSDDGIRALGSLLLEYGRLCRQGEAPGSVADADAADSSAIRGAIAGRLARSEPGSKAAAFLRGLRVLVEVERIAPGHLAGSRRGAEGWSSPLSLAKGTPGREASERVARLYGVGTGILEGEVRLAEAVEVIARNCGVGTLKLLLTPGGRLGVSVVRSIARKGPERQRFAMAEAALERDPLARPAPGVWPMDTRDFAKVPSRLGRALGLVEDCIANLPELLDRERPSDGEREEIRRHLGGIVEDSGLLLRAVEGRGTDGEGARRRTPKSDGKQQRREVKKLAAAVGWLDAARYFVEKTARDVPRLSPGMRPTRQTASQAMGQLRSLIKFSRTLLGMIEATSARRPT